MYKIIYCCLLCILFLEITAQHNSLVIFSNTGSTFQLRVNKILINKNFQANVKAHRIEQGWQRLEIKILENGIETIITDSILIGKKEKFINKEFTYTIENNKKLIFISISELSGPEQPAIPEAPKERVPLVDNSIYGNLYQAKNNKPVFFYNYNKTTKTCVNNLSVKDLNMALRLLNKTNDEEIKLRYANEIIEKNCYTVEQLTYILKLYSTEMDRLNSAKLAYSHISDKDSIQTLMPVFKYKTIQESFKSFLKEEYNITKQLHLQCTQPIKDTEFTNHYNNIKNTLYELEKLKLAKSILVGICISTLQGKQVLELLSHDREKLDLLSAMVNVITDKENIKSLVEVLQFTESKTEYLNKILK